MASRRCALKGCNNSVAESNPNPFCYRHRSLNPNASTTDSEIVELAPELLELQTRTVSERQIHSNALIDATPIDGTYAEQISQACERWKQRAGVDGTVPSMAAKLDSPEALQALRNELVSAGIAPQRITVHCFSGGSRRDPSSGAVQPFGDETHNVLILDRNSHREVIIDPSVSKYAPVEDWNEPVDDQLPSGMTPYSDSPWIGTMEEYTNGGFLKWESQEQIG